MHDEMIANSSYDKPLRILITNLTLANLSGTVTFTRDLAIELKRQGHSPIVYSQALGPTAQGIISSGIPVAGDIRSVTGPVDIIHGHHSTTAAIAIAKFPRTPAIFVCHDFESWHDNPPHLPSIRRYVAIGPTAAERLMYSAGIDPRRVEIISNGVDFGRFQQGPRLPKVPTRALAFCRSTQLATNIRLACSECSIDVDVFGEGAENMVTCPERIMPNYDIVFASGLTAREALTCGRAVICCDMRGLGGFVGTKNYRAWKGNFGLRALQYTISVNNLVGAIQDYDPVEALSVSDIFRSSGSMSRCAESYVVVYRTAIKDFPHKGISEEDHQAAMATHMQMYAPTPNMPDAQTLWPWLRERSFLINRLERITEKQQG